MTPAHDEHPLVTTIRRYLAAIEAHDGSALDFYAPDAVQVELPNRLAPTGARRDLAALREANQRGQQVIRAERYELRNAVVQGDRVALELGWEGDLAVPVGTLAAGDTMRAHFAVFLEFRDGLIVGQRNYDCFEPF